ncbi:MAG: hypothetical protein IJX63_15680 [Lachnospiraceae bacterium]|nr:hypothetical protein [Lachnospiraceae bacterium]
MSKNDKWLEYLIHYVNKKELMSCPECGKDEVEVIILREGRGSTTFHCCNCNVFRHYDGLSKKHI